MIQFLPPVYFNIRKHFSYNVGQCYVKAKMPVLYIKEKMFITNNFIFLQIDYL